MNLRKTLLLGAAAVAAGALALTPATQAANPTGADITSIAVNGVTTAGSVAVGGPYKSGTATFALINFTTACNSGTVAGTVNRGPFVSGATAFSFTTLNLNCPTPLGIAANINVAAGCTVPVNMGNVKQAPLNDNVHVGLTDTGKWFGTTTKPKNHNVIGNAVIGFKCATVTLTGGSTCTARADGTVHSEFNEATKVVNGVTYQDLQLDGTGLVLRNQTAACFGLMTGGVTLNKIDFNVAPVAPAVGPIDFR
jgi:hypothetical protein